MSLVVLAPEIRNSEPPVNSRPSVSPRTPRATNEMMRKTAEMAYQVFWRRTTSSDRSPV